MKSYGGSIFPKYGPPLNCCSTPVHRTESGLPLLLLQCVGMEIFLLYACASSAAGLRSCGEPMCKMKSQFVLLVLLCPSGRPLHAFCNRGIGADVHGRQRECSDCQQRKYGEQVDSSSSSLMAEDDVWCYFCLPRLKSRLANLRIICFVFASFLLLV